MKAYFLNISEEERKSIQEKQRSIYDGYQTLEPKMNKETPLKVTIKAAVCSESKPPSTIRNCPG
jgi:hypothetical protein